MFKATTKGGKLFVEDKNAFKEHLLKFDGKNIILKIEAKAGKKRTTDQNDLYYGIVRKIMIVLLDRGFDDLNVVSLSNYFKKRFLSDIMIDPVTGDDMEIVRSTTSLKVKEFSEYIDTVVRFAIQDMDIPPDSLKPFIDMLEGV